MDLEFELIGLLKNTVWDYKALLHTTGKTSPIPKESKVVTAIIEDYAIKKIRDWAKSLSISTVLPTNEREYPDITLEGKQVQGLTALDIKTARMATKDTCSKITLGSYDGYFRNPDKKMNGCRIPYGQFDKHFVVVFLYNWDKTKPSESMVNIKHIIVCEKWKIASKSSGTGTTKHIGSITNLAKLQNHQGAFESEYDFEQF